MSLKIRLGEMLTQAGLLTPAQLDDALKAQLIYGGKLGTNLVELGFVEIDALIDVLSRQSGLPPARVADLENIPSQVIALLPRELVERCRAVPFRADERSIHVALVDAGNLTMLDEIRFATGRDVRPYIGPEVLLARFLSNYYGVANKERYIRLSEDPMFVASRPSPPQPHNPVSSPDAASQPLNPKQPTTLGEAVRKLLRVNIPKDILAVMLEFSMPFFKTVAVAASRGDQFEFVAVVGPQTVKRRLLGIKVALTPGTLFHGLVQSRRHHVGPMSYQREDSSLLEKFEEQHVTAPVFAVPVVIQDRVELILIGVGVTSLFTVDQLRRFEMLVEKTALATQILRLTNRLSVLPEDLN
jgi:hypothetical protein